MATDRGGTGKTYVVEHLDPELGEWSKLEYIAIAAETGSSGSSFILSSLSPEFQKPPEFSSLASLHTSTQSVEELFPDQKSRVCLLDPAAKLALAPKDADDFDIFLFGGILGDHPPRDRTVELRKKGYTNRNLGSVQMTTDTAARVTRTVVQDKRTYSEFDPEALDEIEYVDFPELKVNEHESVEMPFRYVKSQDGGPYMPKGMTDLISKDAEKGIDDLF